MRTTLLPLLLLCGTAGPVFSQVGPPKTLVTFTGAIEPAGPSICLQGSHALECNGALLQSAELDLTKYEDGLWTFTAFDAGATCPVWNIVDAQPAQATLTQCGAAIGGCPMRWRVGPSGVIGQYVLFFSLGSDFTPLADGQMLQLAAPLEFLGSGLTFGQAPFVELNLPGDPTLIGLDVWLQGARQDIGPVGPLQLTNATCFTIGPPFPPCFQPNC